MRKTLLGLSIAIITISCNSSSVDMLLVPEGAIMFRATFNVKTPSEIRGSRIPAIGEIFFFPYQEKIIDTTSTFNTMYEGTPTIKYKDGTKAEVSFIISSNSTSASWDEGYFLTFAYPEEFGTYTIWASLFDKNDRHLYDTSTTITIDEQHAQPYVKGGLHILLQKTFVKNGPNFQHWE